jgi:molybdenum cofactor cytidylyltransferase
LLAHAVEAMQAVPAIERIVVLLGSEAERVQAEVDLTAVDVVIAEDWADGISASLRTGIAALAEADSVVLTLGDQPRVSSEAIEAVLAAGAPARAVYDGAPGHPVLIGRDLFPEVARLTGDQGARDLLAAHGVTEVDLTALGGSQDVDTPADLELLY